MINDNKVFAPITLPDYRVLRPTIFLGKNESMVAAVQQLTTFKIGSCVINFMTPNSVSMFYNKSAKEYECGLKIYTELIKPCLVANRSTDIAAEDLPKLYDFFEHIQTSIITIYSAVEALSNVAIPPDFSITKKNGKGITETWNKSNIEQWTPTEEKIGKIVPEILNIESPKQLPFWELFIDLKKIRDSIIHQKQSVKKPNEIDAAFLQTLMNESIFEKILAGFRLIQYFCDKNKTHTYFPLLTTEIPVDVKIVESFDGRFWGESLVM